MTTYIKPPASKKCTWRKRPPPSIGWWPASFTRDPKCLRWWDGKYWSSPAFPDNTARHAALIARRKQYDNAGIEWTDPWWPTAQIEGKP